MGGYLSTPDATTAPMPPIRKLCAVCPNPATKHCQSCKNIHYCSRSCQTTDWKTHKLVCGVFQDFVDRPTPDSRRVIVFPVEESNPRFAWATIRKHAAEDEYPYWESLDTAHFIGDAIEQRDLQMIQHNSFLDRELDNTIRLSGREGFLTDGSVDNRSIVKVVHGAPTHTWKGPFVAYRMKGLGIDQAYCDDMDTMDFKMVVDYFIAYGIQHKHIPRYAPAEGGAYGGFDGPGQNGSV